jgi:hypothetical protein
MPHSFQFLYSVMVDTGLAGHPPQRSMCASRSEHVGAQTYILAASLKSRGIDDFCASDLAR